MIEFILILILVYVWLAIEIYRAPQMDELTGRIIKPGRKLKNLFKKKEKYD